MTEILKSLPRLPYIQLCPVIINNCKLLKPFFFFQYQCKFLIQCKGLVNYNITRSVKGIINYCPSYLIKLDFSICELLWLEAEFEILPPFRTNYEQTLFHYSISLIMVDKSTHMQLPLLIKEGMHHRQFVRVKYPTSCKSKVTKLSIHKLDISQTNVALLQ